MKFVSALVSAASGKVRGLVASHNRGGAYFRGKTIPTNPNTLPQQRIRAALKSFVSLFSTGISATQRASFQTYAENVTTTDSLGNAIKLSGQNWFVSQNTLRQLSGRAAVLTCSSNFTLTTFTMPSGTIAASATNGLFMVTLADEWNNNSNGAMIMFASRPQNAGVTFFKGPFQQFLTLAGGGAAATVTATLPFAAGTAGSQIFIRAVATAPDGRNSTGVIFPVKS